MKKIGIICEYNPFHSGHAYQIETVRQREPDAAVVCLMSGNATQRGSFAIADKYTRAKMALLGGADLVLELPYPYSAASAAYFAGAGVAILDALEMDELSFGSESADLPLLTNTAQMTQSAAFVEGVRARQRQGEGSAQAFFSELQARTEAENVRFLANDILALEYIRAIQMLESAMKPMPIQRFGSAYDARTLEAGKHPSATALREQLYMENNESLDLLPVSARKTLKNAIKQGLAPVRTVALDMAILTFFRLCDPDALSGFAEMQGGLAHRLRDAACVSTTYVDMLSAASSKSFPTARLRRAVLYAMTGVTAQDLQCAPGYLSLLAANEKGRTLLREWKTSAPIPIVAKFADAASYSPAAARQSVLTHALDALFTLAMPIPRAADYMAKIPPYMA